jgi:hypothetical protein
VKHPLARYSGYDVFLFLRGGRHLKSVGRYAVAASDIIAASFPELHTELMQVARMPNCATIMKEARVRFDMVCMLLRLGNYGMRGNLVPTITLHGAKVTSDSWGLARPCFSPTLLSAHGDRIRIRVFADVYHCHCRACFVMGARSRYPLYPFDVQPVFNFRTPSGSPPFSPQPHTNAICHAPRFAILRITPQLSPTG